LESFKADHKKKLYLKQNFFGWLFYGVLSRKTKFLAFIDGYLEIRRKSHTFEAFNPNDKSSFSSCTIWY
jgi:hypothetical protein